MAINKIYIEDGVSPEGTRILREITDEIMVMVNLLMATSPNRSDYFFRSCHKESDLMYDRIIDQKISYEAKFSN